MQAKHCKKCGIHRLNVMQIITRRQSSWKLYLKLPKGNWKFCVTSNGAMFCLVENYWRRKVCLRNGYDDLHMINIVKLDAFAAGFMSSTAMCENGKTPVRISPKASKWTIYDLHSNCFRPIFGGRRSTALPWKHRCSIMTQHPVTRQNRHLCSSKTIMLSILPLQNGCRSLLMRS